ncbi:PadR family transcriptional regulator [Oryzihumus sp.]|uniref:PadR family transcriptional regulator n=1 Tax=Oryzihumus sp. TaxID=1968903 RepID=UPI002ED936B9
MTASTSSLGYALLGLLARSAATGYDLTRRMHRPVGWFWTAAHSQVYPELAKLESGGLVEHEVVEGAGPRPTKRYRLTRTGRARLRDWVAEPAARAPERDPLMLKVYSLWLLDRPQAVALVEATRTDHAARLEVYAAQEREMHSRPEALADPRTREFAAWATLRAGISFEQHRLDWCDWLLAALHDPAVPPPAGRGARG